MVPIKLIAIGGYVAVGYLKNRDSTHDIDYILEPLVEQNPEARSELRWAMLDVAKEYHLVQDWINDV